MMPLELDEKKNVYRGSDGQVYPRVTSILSALELGRSYLDIDPYYAERGRVVHRCVELIDKGTLDAGSVPTDAEPFVGAYRKFLDISGYKPWRWEISLWHEKGFAGTLDKVGRINGRLGLIDIKCTDSVDPLVDLQLCAYAVLWNRHFRDMPLEFKYALQLKPNGEPNLVTKYTNTPIALWDSVMEVYQWKKTRSPSLMSKSRKIAA